MLSAGPQTVQRASARDRAPLGEGVLTPWDAPSGNAAREAGGALSAEDGFTMMELLVAMVTGLAVCFALFEIMIVSTHQSAHLTDYAQATQQSRTAMTRIVDELHSACVSPGFAPIQVGSGESELRFIDAFSEEAVIGKTQISEHRIVWSKAAETLTDYTYPATKEVSWPTFEYASTPTPASGFQLAHSVRQSETGGKKIPIFQYYSYSAKASESATAGLSTLNTEPLAVPLIKETAPTAASVLITFNTGPFDGSTPNGYLGKGVPSGLQTQVTLAFSAGLSNNEVVDAPCK